MAAFLVIGSAAAAWVWMRSHVIIEREERRPPVATASSRPQPATAPPAVSRSVVEDRAQVVTSRPRGEDHFGIVCGRIVAAEDGRPLPGAQVSLYGADLDGSAVVIRSATGAGIQSPSPTGADGKFELTLPVHSRLVRSLEIRCEGRVTRRGLPMGLHAEELGDVPLERGFPVGGSVSDTHGAPAGRVRLQLMGAHAGRQLGRDPYGGMMSSATSDRGGAFAMTELVPAGRWQLVVEDLARGTELVGPGFVEVLAEPGVRDLRVVVARKPSIEGTIVDEEGVPRPWANLSAFTRAQDRIGRGLATDGWFAVYLEAFAKPEPVRLHWMTDEVTFREESRTEAWFEWGARDVRLVAKRRPSIELVVFEADTGAPVEEFAVSMFIHPSHPVAHGGFDRTGCRRWPGGRARIETFTRGNAHVKVIPRRRDLLPRESVWIREEDQTAGPVRIGLARSTRFTLRVLRGDRSPVPGALVELVRAERSGPLGHETAVSDERSGFESEGWPDGLQTLVASGITDEDGRVQLHGDPPGAVLALRVRSPAHAPLTVERFLVPAHRAEAEVLVASGAGLDLVVTPASIASLHGAGIVLRKQGASSVFFPGRLENAPLNSDGSAPLRGIPAGSWDVLLAHAGGWLDAPVATATLTEGETTRLELDLPQLVPARLRGTVTWRGTAPWSGTVALVRRMEGQRPTEVQVALDRAGGFVAEGLLPGRYEVRAAMYTAEGLVNATCPGILDLTAAVQRTRVFDQWRKD